MIEHKPYDADSPHTQWDSLYTGEAGDYEEPDADILEAVADLNVGEALDVSCRSLEKECVGVQTGARDVALIALRRRAGERDPAPVE